MAEINQDENIGVESLEEGLEAGNQTRHAIQKEYIKRQRMKAYHNKDRDSPYVKSFADKMKEAADGLKDGVKDAIKKVVDFFREHPIVLVVIIVIALLIGLVNLLITGIQLMIAGMDETVLASTYTAYDEDILGVETDYKKLEKELQKTINNTRTDYPGYDEYEFNLEEIGHNPYELASYLTVKYEDYKRKNMKEVIKEQFNQQYDLTYKSRVETRSREVTKTGYHEVETPGGGSTYVPYSYTETEYYNVTILTVTLKNNGLGWVVAHRGLSEDEQARYQLLLETKGNKEELFTDIYTEYIEPDDYTVPPEALSDQSFAAMIAEAEKYLNRAYVWGGSSPSTGFDCSGFVCWVLNHSGWSVGRTDCNGLKNKCTIVSAEEAKPGDLIFFKGTQKNKSGATHVGIYCGNGIMIHCGNPIQYTSINGKYYKEHFLCFGRMEAN